MKRFYALLVYWTVHRQKLLLGLIGDGLGAEH